MAVSLEQAASRVLGVLVKAQEDAEAVDVDQVTAEVPGEAIRAATGLTPALVSRAVELLKAEGYAEVETWLGTAPFEFGTARATPHGRVEYERARAEALRQEAAEEASRRGGLDSPLVQTTLRRPRPEVESIIERAIERGEALLASAEDLDEGVSYEAWVHDLGRWHALTRDALASCYENDEPASEFYAVATGGIIRQLGQSRAETFENYQAAARGAINTLRSLHERLDYAESPAPPAPEAPTVARDVGPGVFLVHGHDVAATQTVARFLDRVTEPGATVLAEQPDQGKTIIEKFEQYASQAGYAVVLLTSDDEGRKRDSAAELRPRARQNVVLELGFFIGVLGRGRVALLYEQSVELPSDISGVLYLSLDPSGAWKTKLAREMMEAGVGVNSAEALRA
jgi:predicted nucleotide-binding protein